MYRGFANLYDILMDDIDYGRWFEYIKEIFSEEGAEPKSILEMACGTGNLTEYLAREGYKVTCFDISEEMLSIAKSKLSSFRNVKILRQDMVDFQTNKEYDSVLAICDSINYILKREDLISNFRKVYEHLKDGGLFIFDINSYYKIRNILGNNIFIEDREGVFYSWDNRFNEENNICDFYLTFFYEEEKGIYNRIDEHHRERAYNNWEIIEALEEAGFKEIKKYEAFTFKKTKEETERINFLVKK